MTNSNYTNTQAEGEKSSSGVSGASSLHGLAKDDGVKLEGEGRPESPSVSLHGRHGQFSTLMEN